MYHKSSKGRIPLKEPAQWNFVLFAGDFVGMVKRRAMNKIRLLSVYGGVKSAQIYRDCDKLGGGFKYFLCSPLFGEDVQFYLYFSHGLVEPPTSKPLVGSLLANQYNNGMS